jgi:regulator of sigma E protease
MLQTIVLFILSLFVVIVVHELGHFLVSKRVGVEVEEFGIGFPPRICGRKWRGTLYSLNALPIGAFVKSRGQDGAANDIEGSLAAASPWRRFLVYAAGPGSNILLAFLLFSIFFVFPRALVVSDGLLVYQVQEGSAAAEADLRSGDVIVTADGDQLQTWNELQDALARVPAQQTIALEILRDDSTFVAEIAPQYSETLGRNVIGITLGRNVVQQVAAGSPAASADIQVGDSLLGVNGVAVIDQSDLDAALSQASVDSPVTVTMLRGEQTYTVDFSESGVDAARLGLQLKWAPGSRIDKRSISFTSAVASSARYIVAMPALIVASFPLIRDDPSLAFVGPIGAGQLTVEAVETFGLSNLVFIAGLISIGIALFNLIPVPPLDGGGMLVAVVEAARRGRRLSERALRLSYAAGTALLITLVVFITTSDLLRLLQGRGFGL